MLYPHFSSEIDAFTRTKESRSNRSEDGTGPLACDILAEWRLKRYERRCGGEVRYCTASKYPSQRSCTMYSSCSTFSLVWTLLLFSTVYFSSVQTSNSILGPNTVNPSSLVHFFLIASIFIKDFRDFQYNL